MLKNFHLAAIVKQRGETFLRQIPLDRASQDTLAESWQTQYDAFVHGEVREIDFHPGYQPEEDEIFRLSDYQAPDWLAEKDSQTLLDLDPISGNASARRSNKSLLNAAKGIAAFSRNEYEKELVLFQNFTPSQIILPGRFLLLQQNTYRSSNQPGLTLSNRLGAVYQLAERKLLFQNFRTANTFLPLSDFYKEASEQEIREVLSHAKFAPEDPDALAIDASQWNRKRFAMLKDSNVLDRYSVKQIAAFPHRSPPAGHSRHRRPAGGVRLPCERDCRRQRQRQIDGAVRGRMRLQGAWRRRQGLRAVRVVARLEARRKESDVQPLVEGLQSALLQWRAE